MTPVGHPGINSNRLLICDTDILLTSIGRINEIDSEFHRAADNSNGLVAILRLTPDSFAGDSHRAEPQAVDGKTAADGKVRCIHFSVHLLSLQDRAD
jgi:hypothetical protein